MGDQSRDSVRLAITEKFVASMYPSVARPPNLPVEVSKSLKNTQEDWYFWPTFISAGMHVHVHVHLLALGAPAAPWRARASRMCVCVCVCVCVPLCVCVCLRVCIFCAC